ncbi:hypothetical protein [Haloferula rosea]|uniref:Uncharacterized protein n=1 Tax=Haloferula rosea TaxID=490093 RepID=A0A934RB90_9BACT|nr:hypothetical protein [Haloferula rosea]MBK1825806.1 hypothetical protein [Haloferula rosea]
MKALLRYQQFLLILVMGTAVLGYALNTWVNPWRVTPTAWSSAAFDDYRAIDNEWNRTAKAGLAASGDWDAALFGSSRVDIAFDPEHSLFEGRNCANLGLNAASISENHRIFSYFMDHHDPELLVFAIDPGDLTTPHSTFNLTDFSLSPLNPDADPIERELRYREGISTLAASFDTIQRRLQHKPAEHTPQGFRRDAPFPDNQRQLIAGLYLATTVRMVKGRTRYGQLDPTKLDLLDDVIERCRTEDCRLVILLTPNHGLFQLSYEELGDPDPIFEADRRALAERATHGVEVWDFLDAHPINSEPLPPAEPSSAHLRYWIDLFHATPEVGNLMLDRIAGEPGDFGVRLTTDTIDARLEDIRAGLAAYRETRPEDVAFLQKSLDRYRPKP